MTINFRPVGSIKTIEEALTCIGLDLFVVYRYSAKVIPYKITGEIIPHRSRYGDVVSLFFAAEEYSEYMDKMIKSEHSFLDRNIPSNRYNGHFIFTNRDDAEAYCKFLRDNGLAG